MIKKLRKLGGEWKANRIGFGYYEYVGVVNGKTYRVQSYAHLRREYDGDDECYSVWHAYDSEHNEIARSSVDEILIDDLFRIFKKEQ